MRGRRRVRVLLLVLLHRRRVMIGAGVTNVGDGVLLGPMAVAGARGERWCGRGGARRGLGLEIVDEGEDLGLAFV